jgi:hypothetical protein
MVRFIEIVFKGYYINRIGEKVICTLRRLPSGFSYDEFRNSISIGNIGLYVKIARQHGAYISEGISALKRIYQQGGMSEPQLNSANDIPRR